MAIDRTKNRIAANPARAMQEPVVYRPPGGSMIQDVAAVKRRFDEERGRAGPDSPLGAILSTEVDQSANTLVINTRAGVTHREFADALADVLEAAGMGNTRVRITAADNAEAMRAPVPDSVVREPIVRRTRAAYDSAEPMRTAIPDSVVREPVVNHSGFDGAGGSASQMLQALNDARDRAGPQSALKVISLVEVNDANQLIIKIPPELDRARAAVSAQALNALVGAGFYDITNIKVVSDDAEVREPGEVTTEPVAATADVFAAREELMRLLTQEVWPRNDRDDDLNLIDSTTVDGGRLLVRVSDDAAISDANGRVKQATLDAPKWLGFSGLEVDVR